MVHLFISHRLAENSWREYERRQRASNATSRARRLEESAPNLPWHDIIVAATTIWAEFTAGHTYADHDLPRVEQAEQANVFALLAPFMPAEDLLNWASDTWDEHFIDCPLVRFSRTYGWFMRSGTDERILITIYATPDKPAKTRDISPYDDAVLVEPVVDPEWQSPIETALLTPEHVANEGHIEIADYLAARGMDGADLAAMHAPFRDALVAEYVHTHGHAPTYRVVPGLSRSDFTFGVEDKPLIDRVFNATFLRRTLESAS